MTAEHFYELLDIRGVEELLQLKDREKFANMVAKIC